MSNNTEKKNSFIFNLQTVIGIIMCVILTPILIINCTLLFKGYTNKDEVPSVGGIFPMIILTDSMSGVFESGDLIICKNITPAEVQANDVITYFDPAGNGTSVVTHRVLEIVTQDGELFFKTKGDANNTEDKDLMPAENLIGIYTGFHIPGAGNVAMFMQTTTGLVICVVLPIVLLVGYDTIRRNKYNKKHESEKDQLLAELEELRKLKAQQENNV